MATFPTNLLAQLDGARMVATKECEICGALGISYWNGAATVNSIVLSSGEVLGEDVWTNYALQNMPPWAVGRALREQLIHDMCSCLSQVPRVG